MADWDTNFKDDDVTPSPKHSRQSSLGSMLSYTSTADKENHTALHRLDSEVSTADSERELVLRGGSDLKQESRTEIQSGDFSAMTNGHGEETPARSTKPSSHSIFPNGNAGSAKTRVAKSPFAPATIDSISEEEVTIPNDGNLSTFTADQMANFFRCLKIDDRLISHLHRKKVDGKRFSKLKDSELENIGLQKHAVILFFRDKSANKTKKGSPWIL